jgi:hypothetical protein
MIFYVGAKEKNNPLTGYVPAKFLMRSGAYVMDPTPGGSQQAYPYSDASDANKTPGQEPTPPAWPPRGDTPIRYLGRRVQ